MITIPLGLPAPTAALQAQSNQLKQLIREEIRHGTTPQAAIQAGYERAFATIVDSNVTTLIVALILFMIATSTIKAFFTPIETHFNHTNSIFRRCNPGYANCFRVETHFPGFQN